MPAGNAGNAQGILCAERCAVNKIRLLRIGLLHYGLVWHHPPLSNRHIYTKATPNDRVGRWNRRTYFVRVKVLLKKIPAPIFDCQNPSNRKFSLQRSFFYAMNATYLFNTCTFSAAVCRWKMKVLFMTLCACKILNNFNRWKYSVCKFLYKIQSTINMHILCPIDFPHQ